MVYKLHLNKTVKKKICIHMFIAALLMLAKRWKNFRRPLTRKWLRGKKDLKEKKKIKDNV